MRANQYTQRPLVTLRWHAGVQSHHQWGIYKKATLRGLNNNTEQTNNIFAYESTPSVYFPSPESPAFLKHIFWWQKHLQSTHRSAPYLGLWLKVRRALSPLLTGNCSFVCCIVQRREMRRLPSPFTAVQSTAYERVKPLHLHATPQQLCRSMRGLPVRLWARDEGAVSGTPHQSSRERFAFQPPDDTMDCGTAVSMSPYLSTSGPPTMSSNCGRMRSPYCPLIRLNQGSQTLRSANAQMFTLNALWNFKNVLIAH